MPAYLFGLPLGVPGQISRDSATVEPQLLASSGQPTAFGVPVAIDATSHKCRAIASGDDAADVYGFLVRPYPFQSTQNDFGGESTVPTSGAVSVVKRGYILVKLNNGTAVNNGTVYVRVANASGAKVIGGIEATADSTNTVGLTNAYFTGVGDADAVEVAFNI